MTLPTAGQTTLIADRYELQERLGAGGAAEVWLAQDTLLARPVAVKVLDRRLAADVGLVDQFKREAQSAAILNHPNIVAVYDWGRVDATGTELDGTYFLVMEYVPGSNLKELVRRRGALPEPTALRLVDQIGAALEVAHQHGIVHCDVKPHNVLLDAHGRPKVADFGLACALGLTDGDQPGLVGSAHYLAPERARGAPVDPRCDIYGLGAVLFELLTGQVPFAGDDVQTIVRRHLEEPPPSPRTRQAAVSPQSEAIVLRCLAKDPAARFPSATDLRDALADAQASLLASLELTQALPSMPHGADRAPDRPTAGRASRVPLAPAVWPAVRARARGLAERGVLWWLVPVAAVLLLALFAAQLRPIGRGTPTTVAGVQATPAASSPPFSLLGAAAAAASGGSGQPCRFVLGFKQLRDKLGDAVGDCLEDEHPDPRTGETVQRTTRGLFQWSPSDRITRFTDGRRTWVDGPHGVQVRAVNERFRWELGQTP